MTSKGWNFRQTADDRWEWLRSESVTGEQLARCDGTFATLAECINDAARHGYDRRTPEDRRRDQGT